MMLSAQKTNLKNKKPKKLRASIVLTISILILAIIIFAICAIDTGHIVTSRYKTQKVTETIALYMASTLKALPVDKRNEESLKIIKENFEKLYSEYKLSGYHSFKIIDIQIKDKESDPKVKVSTETLIPPLFLRYAKIGIIKVRQNAYAKSEETQMTYKPSLSKKNYYTFKAKNLITDKKGDDIKVEYDGGYFLFAGLEDSNGEIRWTEIGSLASDSKTQYTLTDKVTGDEIKAYCIENTNTFDLNSDPKKTIGLVKYLRLYKNDCTTEDMPEISEGETGETGEGAKDPEEGAKEGDIETPPKTQTEPSEEGEETETEETPSEGGGDEEEADDEPEGTPPTVTVLNSVKLIKKSKF